MSRENKDELFKGLLHNFLEANNEVNAVIVSDADGLIIAGETRIDTDLEIVSVLTAIVNPILERIRKEFAFKKFGTASFDTDVSLLPGVRLNTVPLVLCLKMLAVLPPIS